MSLSSPVCKGGKQDRQMRCPVQCGKSAAIPLALMTEKNSLLPFASL